MTKLYTLLAILFISLGHLYAQGRAKWHLQSSGINTSIRGIDAVDENTCWIGSQGVILKTIDGGMSWDKIVIPGAEALDFRDIEAFDAMTCLAMSAGTGKSSKVYKTTDGGLSWTLVLQNELNEGFYNGMAFWDREHGLLAGDPVNGRLHLFKTTDGGETWQVIPPGNLPHVKEGEYGFAASGTHLATLGDHTLFIGTGGTVARIHYTHDRGDTWNVVDTPMTPGNPSQGIFSIACHPGGFVMAVGGDYKQENYGENNIIITTDAGKSWSLASHLSLDFRSCAAILGNIILLAGPSGSEISFDQGRNFESLSEKGFHTLSIGPDMNSIWAAGVSGKVAKLKLSK